jgi:23S rRNA pseudouridine2605 synthase
MAKKTETAVGRSAKKAAPASKGASALKPSSVPAKSSKAVKPRASKEIESVKAKSAPVKAKAKPRPKTAAKTKTEIKAKTKAEIKSEAKSEIKTAAKPATTKPRKTKSQAKPVAPPAPAIDLSAAIPNSVDDPIGDLSDGEARVSTGRDKPDSLAQMAAYRADTAEEALDGTFETPAEESSSLTESAPTGSDARQDQGDDQFRDQRDDQPVKLDRLQKILSQAGIASRRHAEEMILAGRIMVNGQVVTQLGAKADPARDHIKVDGKLISAPERHRYFMLNKPRGFVTTVSDPEGRPTVMQFFAKMRERLYPVGRLDYESEGLLLVTNDGDLANQLTRAASGVEKTYLVKVAGRPTLEEIDKLRSGVLIERGETGSEKTQTAPARIHEFHTGAKHGGAKPGRAGSQPKSENPWYEVVLIEGRNRELRKMFQSVGHFVEKIRRVGYGPLVLDVEPGQLRELTPPEIAQLRRTAEGKSKPVDKPRRIEAPHPDAGRPPESRREPEQEHGFDPGPNRSPNRSFDKRAPGKPDHFAARSEKPFRKFDSSRGPRPGSNFGPPRRDDRGGDAQRGDNLSPGRSPGRFVGRGDGRAPDRNPNRGFDRGPDRRPSQGYARDAKPPFSAPRKEFGRPAAAPENGFPNRPPNRPGPNGGQFDRPGPARSGPNRFGPKRPDALRGASKPFGARPNFAPRSGEGSRPRFDSGSRSNPGSRPSFKPKFDRGPSSFHPRPNPGPNPRPNLDIRPVPRSDGSGFDAPREASNPRRPSRPFSGPPPRGDFRSGARPNNPRFGAGSDRGPGRNPGGNFAASGEKPSRPAWKKSSPRFSAGSSPRSSSKSSYGSSPARGAGRSGRGGKPNRNPPRPGGPRPGGSRPGGSRPGGRKPGGPRPGGRKGG